jgi:hypothetical protein
LYAVTCVLQWTLSLTTGTENHSRTFTYRSPFFAARI